MKLAVRCCCDPSKVLGYIDNPLLQKLGDRLKWDWMAPASELKRFGFVDGVVVRCRLELEVAQVTIGERTILAVKNNDYAIKDLKRVPGFEPLVKSI